MIAETDCPTPRPIRTFDIEAISLPIVYNKYGDHDPNGLMYVLKKKISQRTQKKARENFALSPPQPYEEYTPLVIRANVGDEIRINFYNRLNRKASIHVQGLAYDVKTSDGANVGFNPIPPPTTLSSTLACGSRRRISLSPDDGETRAWQ
ncbi:MAG: multicopper oxidase domain-containing protein [Clostridia bacterium]